MNEVRNQPPPEHCFEVTPYRPDGGFSSAGLALCIVLTLAAATGLGYAVFWLDGWATEVEWLWVILAAVLLLALGCLAVHWGRVRNGAAAAVVGLLAGVQLLGAVRWFGYESALPRLEDDARRLLPAKALLEVHGNIAPAKQQQPNVLLTQLQKRLAALPSQIT